MHMRTPSILLTACSNLNTLSVQLGASSTSSISARKSTRPRPCGRTSRKSYATVTGDNSDGHEHVEDVGHTWPEPIKGQSNPTPYQIFAMKTTATYSKTRYYELVKMYHPDRSSPNVTDIPPSIKLERYRLIVAAHAILSDPARRSAYDRFGAGWNGRAETPNASSHGNSHPAGPFTRSWQDPSDPIWQNATWEDWQRYYEWRANREGNPGSSHRYRQSPVYFQNSYFIFLVALLALAGSTANTYRAHDAGSYFIHQRDIVHDRTAKELRRVRQDATTSGSRKDRIDWFLRNREATLGGLADGDGEALRQEKVDRLLPDRETCNSDEVAEKGG